MTNELIVFEFNYVLNKLKKGGVGTGICDCFRDGLTMKNFRILKEILKETVTKKSGSMWWFPLNEEGLQQRINTVTNIIEKYKRNIFTETIECQECKSIELANVEQTFPFYTLIHNCSNCGNIITESDWVVVKTCDKPLVLETETTFLK
jgi:hypothetical protein